MCRQRMTGDLEEARQGRDLNGDPPNHSLVLSTFQHLCPIHANLPYRSLAVASPLVRMLLQLLWRRPGYG